MLRQGGKVDPFSAFSSISPLEGQKSKNDDFGPISKYLAPNLVKSVISYLIFDTKSIQSGGQGQAHGFFLPLLLDQILVNFDVKKFPIFKITFLVNWPWYIPC